MQVIVRFSWLYLFLAIPALGQTQPLKAFPGAQGFGSLATGGRGGDVYIVTNLNDSGPGSLRFGAENASGPRTIVFEVGGTIHLNIPLRIQNKQDLTIAGQTAPADGILLSGNMFQTEGCRNLIVRHLRVRYDWDNVAESDAIWLRNTKNAIFDQISTSWGMDECFSLTRDTSEITVSNCLIAEGAKDGHQYGMLIDTETEGGGKVTLVGNLFINHLGRMPRAGSNNNQPMLLDMVNNVVYNWSSRGDWGPQGTALDANTQANWNFVGNYSIAGRNTGSAFFRESILRGGDGLDRFYIEGNRLDSNVNGVLDGFDASWENVRGDFVQMETSFSMPGWAEVNPRKTADEALQHVIDRVGAFPTRRDATDDRLIRELTSWGTEGLMVNAINRPDRPTVVAAAGPTDADRDGKPDGWENWYGTDPGIPSNNQPGRGGYTSLEAYLQWLTDPDTVFALGDANGDDRVDSTDLFILLANWGGVGKSLEEGDLTGEGEVGFPDLALLARRWGWAGTPPQAP